MLIVTAPLWFKAPFKILRLFVREKLRDRVFTVSVPQLSLHIPRDSLPKHLGGTLDIDHSSWLLHCYKSMTNREEEELLTNGQQQHQQQQQSPITEQVTTNNNDDDDDDDDTTPATTTTTHGGALLGTNITPATQINDVTVGTNNVGSIITESWQENPPSSASSGFSDDDSLTGADGCDFKTIEQIVEMVKERTRRGLIKEYAEIRQRAPDGTFTHAKMRNNLTKNRYTDVLCYDHSRVVLSHEDEDPTSDYINANFVDGYKQRNAYISTQGKSLLFSKNVSHLILMFHSFIYQDHSQKLLPTFGAWYGNSIVS